MEGKAGLLALKREDARPGDDARVLEILITGEVAGDVQFWFVRNSDGLHEPDWTHKPPRSSFLDSERPRRPDGYIERARQDLQTPGAAKDQILERATFSFRQGVLAPGATVFEGFSEILRVLYQGRVSGFDPVASLDDLGRFARVRMEFLKRFCTARYGIYADGIPTPVGGVIHVWGAGRDGRIVEYRKDRTQIKVRRPGRTAPTD